MRDQEALIEFIEAAMRTTFAWGSHDCVTFAAGAIEAQTGRRVLEAVQGGWTDERSARRALARRRGLAAAVGRILSPVPPALAHRGDIGAVHDPRGDLALVVIEGATIVGPGPDGLVRQPRSVLVQAWSVQQ